MYTSYEQTVYYANFFHKNVPTAIDIICQDWFSQSEADMNGDAKVMGEHVGCGNYCSRVIGVKARRVVLVVGGVMAIV